MSAASLDTLADLLDAALAADDTAGAKGYATRMLAALARKPDSMGANSSLRWDRTALVSLIATLRADATNAAVASTGIRRTNINKVNPGESSDCCCE